MVLVGDILSSLIIEEGKNAFLSAVDRLHTQYKSKEDWKKLFVDTGEFFIDHEKNADKIFDDLALVLSRTNMEKLAKEFDKESGYDLKDRLLNSLIFLMKQYEIPRDIAYSYSCRILIAIINEMQRIRPEKYDQLYQAEWRKQEQKVLAEIKERIERVRAEIKQFESVSLGIRSADDMELELRRSSKDIKIGIDFFEIDDDAFKESFNEQRDNKVICIRSRCKEEAIFCVINELWSLGDSRAVFVIDSKEDWEKLSHIKGSNNIYIPRFFEEEIIPIENNTNIFIYTDGLPSFSKNEIELRPRMKSTLSRILQDSGMSYEATSALIEETHGLYVPMKKKLFSRAYLKQPKWVSELPDNIVKTALLIGQWTDADGDQIVVEELSGLKYDEFKNQILNFSQGEDPFIYVVNHYSKTTYMLASAEISWEYIDVPNDCDIWKKFIQCFIDVTKESEKMYTYSHDERMLAQIKGEKMFYSTPLRDGMTRSVILKAYYKNDEKCQYELDELTQNILDGITTEEQWRFFANFFVAFCEISPLMIIKRVNKEFDCSTGFLGLFEKQSEDFLFERNPYINVLWGMEQMLTQEKYVADSLTWFLKIDDRDYSYTSNTPRDVLIKVFCTWYNFSSLATVDNKVYFANKAFDIDRNAWDIIFESLPFNHRSILGRLSYPKYRQHINESYVTNGELSQITKLYLELLINHAGCNADRWNRLIDIADEAPKEYRQIIIDSLKIVLKAMSDDEKLIIHNNLRETIYKHRFYSSAAWACNEETLHEYEILLKDIAFEKPEYGFVYLFHNRGAGIILDPIKYDEDKSGENDKRINQHITEQLLEFKKRNYDVGLLAKLCGSENDSTLGKELALIWDNCIYNPERYSMLSEAQESKKMALDYALKVMVADIGSFSDILDLSEKLHFDEKHIVRLYHFQADLSCEIPEIDKAPQNIKRQFWSEILIPNNIDYKWCLSECQKYGNIESYIGTLFYIDEKENLIPSELLSYILFTDSMPSIPVGQMFEYYLKTLLSKIQREYLFDDSIRNKLSLIELRFYQLLEWDNMVCFQKEIKQTPLLYAEMARLLFKSDNDEIIKTDDEKKAFSNIFRLYDKAKFCPGEENGTIKEAVFENWIKEFRNLLSKNHQTKLFNMLIGRLLAHSPCGDDGFYPCEVIRSFIEDNAERDLITSFQNEIFNSRGVFTSSAGKEELRMATKYKENADYLTVKYPRTASIYYGLYEQYRVESQKERENAETGSL